MMHFLVANPPLLAGIFTLLGGVGLKVVEKFMNKNVEKRDDRKEFREQIEGLQKRLDEVEKEVTFWRNRFYEEQEDNATLRIQMITGGLTPPTKTVIPPS